jgi:hypothetical protein
MLARLVPFLVLAAASPAEPAGWEPWAYVYGVGGAVFAIGLGLCLWTRRIDLRERRGRRTLLLMVAGFVGYAILQGVMQLALPRW